MSAPLSALAAVGDALGSRPVVIVAATGDALQEEAARIDALAGERPVFLLPDNKRDQLPVWPASHYGEATPS